MKTATKVALSFLSLMTGAGACNVGAFNADAFHVYQDRIDAADREIARIVSETDADRREAAIVRELLAVR